ncbi:hypothetical protein E4U58_000675, partial [Claviceps cyperi]
LREQPAAAPSPGRRRQAPRGNLFIQAKHQDPVLYSSPNRSKDGHQHYPELASHTPRWPQLPRGSRLQLILTDLKSQACHKPILGLTVDGARNAEANTEGATPESRSRQEDNNLLRTPKSDISGKDFTPGITYVAVSRVKSLQGIMFDGPFDLPDITTRPKTDQLADLERRKSQDAMNGLIDTDMNEELMTAGIDNDEDLSDSSSEDIYGVG